MTKAEEAKAWLEHFYEKILDGCKHLDLVYSEMDDWLRAGEFERFVALIEALDLDKLSITQTLSFMIMARATHQQKDTTCYPAFYERCAAKFQAEEPTRAIALLHGLAPDLN